jgi:hypothetical protein
MFKQSDKGSLRKMTEALTHGAPATATPPIATLDRERRRAE